MIKNYLASWTEGFREWLAWKVFPELSLYVEAIKRLSQIDENDRVVQILSESDSACSEWAIDLVEIKYGTLQGMIDKFKEDGFDEPPF